MRRGERDVVLVQIPRLDPADVLDLLDRGDVQRPVLGQLLRNQEPLPPKIGALGRVLGRVCGDELWTGRGGVIAKRREDPVSQDAALPVLATALGDWQHAVRRHESRDRLTDPHLKPRPHVLRQR